ncbi:hypothetical protein KC19_12G054600 [Ceratodon purpureus]|uniref:Uncharacterized protein n=1 Tax=Ceratodon purpureus TaxID=3225 RepID=A0A8T0G3Y7_CERPU|nr:hypothetical protein KC19_12G054600 [Ceratodon purpureus]
MSVGRNGMWFKPSDSALRNAGCCTILISIVRTCTAGLQKSEPSFIVKGSRNCINLREDVQIQPISGSSRSIKENCLKTADGLYK